MILESKLINLKSNKQIFIYDNLFELEETQKFYLFAKSSYFGALGFDGPYEETPLQFSCMINKDNLQSMAFTETKAYTLLNEKHELNHRNIKQVRFNLSNCFERSVAHTDKKGLTLIYYPNLKWDIFWGGHTLFLSEDLSEIEYTAVYKPGRVLMFDGSIPHCISSISISCRVHRYSFVIQYGEKLNNE